MSRRSIKPAGLPVIHDRAAGIDIGARFHVVGVAPELCDEAVQTFLAFTGDIERMADWLVSIGIETVAMESTGVYWVPVYEVLQSRGIEVIVANAREARSVPGRKSDVNDAQWLQRLHACGLLRASFRPERHIAALRAYLERLRWPQGFVCPSCGGMTTRPYRASRTRLLCKDCGHQSTVTAGTIFDKTRTPLKVWLAAAWYVTHQKQGVSALGLQRVLGLGSYQTAWTMLHRFRRAMVRPDREPLKGVVELDETYLAITDRKQPISPAGRKNNTSKVLIVLAVEILQPKGFSMHESLATGRLDIARLYNASPSPDIELTPLLEEPLYLVQRHAGKGPPPARRRAVPLREVAALPLVIPSRPNAIRMLVEGEMANLGCRPKVALEIDGVAAILDLVEDGAGSAVLSRNAIATSARPQAFSMRPITAPNLRSKLLTAMSSQRPATLTQKAVLQLIHQLAHKLLGPG